MLKRIAFQGELGSFAEDAIFKFFTADEVVVIACPTLENLTETLESNEAEFVVLPVKNSIAGEVESVKKTLESIELKQVAEIDLQIRQTLIACRKATLGTIEIVESHKVALAQCGKFFKKNPNLNKIESVNTALSAKRVIESADITRAAIANARTADIYGGKIILENIQDNNKNFTTFYLLKK